MLYIIIGIFNYLINRDNNHLTNWETLFHYITNGNNHCLTNWDNNY